MRIDSFDIIGDIVTTKHRPYRYKEVNLFVLVVSFKFITTLARYNIYGSYISEFKS